jgi:hypothetical protein
VGRRFLLIPYPEGPVKKLLLLSSTLAALLFLASTAWADGSSSTDPKMIPTGGSAGGCGSTMVNSSSSFTIAVNSDGNSTPGSTGGDCFNYIGLIPPASLTVSGMLPTSLITLDGNPCTSDLYEFASTLFSKSSCSFNSNTDVLTVTFFGTNSDFPGIAPGGKPCPEPTAVDETNAVAITPYCSEFYMDLSGWSGVSSFSGKLQIPEPDSLALLALGLLALVIGCHKKVGILRS